MRNFRMELIWPELFSARTLVPPVVNEEQDLTAVQLGGTVNKPCYAQPRAVTLTRYIGRQ